jgi:hypothetical protein
MRETGPGRTAPWDAPGAIPVRSEGGKMRRVKFFKSFTFAWWQLSLFKLSMVAFGLVVGSTWPEVFARWKDLLLVLFFVPAFYVSYVWLRQL